MDNFKYLVRSIKVGEWSKMFAIVGGAQTIIQALGLLSGLIIIRFLPKQEYALYTIANSILGAMCVLSDGGISTAILALGAKNWQDRAKLSAILQTGLLLRRKFSFVIIGIACPITIFLLHQNDASYIYALVIFISMIPAFYAAVSDSLLEIIPKLHGKIYNLQQNQIAVSVSKILFNFLVFLVPFTSIALIGNGIARIFGNIQLKKINSHFTDDCQSNTELSSEILLTVKKAFPGLLYYCFSGQISMWILSTIGSTDSIANVGALSRISIIISTLSSMSAALLIPSFSKSNYSRENTMAKFIQSLLLFSGACFIFFLSTIVFSNEYLQVLGTEYVNLNYELMLSVAGAAIFSITGFMYGLSSAKGYILKPAVYVTGSILSMVVGAVLFEVSSLDGILYYNLFVAFVQFTMYLLYCMHVFEFRAIWFKKNNSCC